MRQVPRRGNSRSCDENINATEEREILCACARSGAHVSVSLRGILKLAVQPRVWGLAGGVHVSSRLACGLHFL